MKKNVYSKLAKILLSFKDFSSCDFNFLLFYGVLKKKKKKKRNEKKKISTAVIKLDFILQGHGIFRGWSVLEISSVLLNFLSK